MKESSKKYLRVIGLITATVLIALAWVFGFFSFIFYLFGFYAAIYLVSILFRTKVIIGFLLGAGGVFFYILIMVQLLYNLYQALKIMFEVSFLWGLLFFVVGLPIATMLTYAVLGGIGFVLGAPLIWFNEDLERRFSGHREAPPPYQTPKELE